MCEISMPLYTDSEAQARKSMTSLFVRLYHAPVDATIQIENADLTEEISSTHLREHFTGIAETECRTHVYFLRWVYV